MRNFRICTTAATLCLCLLAGLVVPRLRHWNWHQDRTGSPRAGLTKRSAASTLRFRRIELLANARTAAAALRYLLQPETPITKYQVDVWNDTPTNPPGQGVCWQRMSSLAASNHVTPPRA